MLLNIEKIIEYPHFYLILSLLFLFLSFNPINLYAAWRLYQRLERGESLPDRLELFPVQETSIDDYLNSWEKVECFKREVLRGNSCEITLNSSDINHIYLKGNPINKYNINDLYPFVPLMSKYHNEFLYFHISSNAVLSKRVEYFTMSSFGMPDGIVTETREDRFKNIDNGVGYHGCVVEWNGKKMDSDRDWTEDKFTASLRCCNTLKAILTGDFNPPVDRDINQEALISSIIGEITQIDISDGLLTIKAGGNPVTES
jgi:hypothetical protein